MLSPWPSTSSVSGRSVSDMSDLPSGRSTGVGVLTRPLPRRRDRGAISFSTQARTYPPLLAPARRPTRRLRQPTVEAVAAMTRPYPIRALALHGLGFHECPTMRAVVMAPDRPKRRNVPLGRAAPTSNLDSTPSCRSARMGTIHPEPYAAGCRLAWRMADDEANEARCMDIRADSEPVAAEPELGGG